MGQGVANVGDLDVFAVLVVAAELEDQGLDVRLDPPLRHLLHHLAHPQVPSLLHLRRSHEERVKHTNAVRQHCDL